MTSTNQEEIKQWFEKTYATRAEQYLRPPKAYETFLHLLHPNKGEKLLDVACGIGQLLLVAEQFGLEASGIDLSENAIAKAKVRLPNAHFQQGNAESLPYQDEAFDHITCIGSLERIINLEQALAEQLRVGKKTAKYCYMVRNSDTLKWKVLKKGLGMVNKKGHQGAKSLEEWRRIFDEAGFEVIQEEADQWPMHKVVKFSSLGLKNLQTEKFYKGIVPLKYANEFIFLLQKKQ